MLPDEHFEVNIMKTQQEWVKNILFRIMKMMQEEQYNGDLSTEGYRYTINAAIDNYSQTYWDDEKKKNISVFHKYASFDTGIYRNILMSEKAYAYMCDYSKKAPDMDKRAKDRAKEKMKKALHGEHLTPQSYTRHRLNKLLHKQLTDQELRNGIESAFSDAKICIITKEESLILDGAKKTFSESEIRAFLSDYQKIRPDISKDVEKEFLDLNGSSKKSNGSGSIRLYILWKNGVQFVDHDGEQKSFQECIDYLEDGNYIV